MRRAIAVVVVVALAVLAGRPGARAGGPECDANRSHYVGADPRVDHVTVAGRSVYVLRPPGYGASTARYPTVYLFHGGGANADDWLVNSDVVAFTGSAAPAIVVLPDLGYDSVGQDWHDGSHADDAFLSGALIPWVDATYRTRASRAYRAAAGFSGGGLAALQVAARHPDQFAAVGAFSPPADNDYPMNVVAWLYLGTATPDCDSPSNPTDARPFGINGNPVTDAAWWHAYNPPDVAGNLGGVSVWMASGDQTPCDAQDVSDAAAFLPFSMFEQWVHATTNSLDRALTTAGVAHTYDAYGCGVHTWRYADRDLHAWWGVAQAAFGTPPPAIFDYRAVDPAFSVYGWTFTTDPARAPEFLDVADAGREGLGLTGSGRTTVTTPPWFRRGRTVRLDGATTPVAVADRQGRLTFTVDLGPAHTVEQFTPQQRVLAPAGGYFTSRTIRFRR